MNRHPVTKSVRREVHETFHRAVDHCCSSIVPDACFIHASRFCPGRSHSPLLTRHVREVTLNGQAPFVGRLPATQSMRIDIVLPVRDQAGLDNFLQEVYDPSSPTYRQFLTVEQFTERFGPSQED